MTNFSNLVWFIKPEGKINIHEDFHEKWNLLKKKTGWIRSKIPVRLNQKNIYIEY